MDLYDILGVARSARETDIRRAFRRLARKYHPDINPGDGEARTRFGQITIAFETLTDPEQRQAYDVGGRVEPGGGGQGAFGFEGFDFSIDAASAAQASTFGDLFADVLSRVADTDVSRRQDGAELHASLSLSFEEAMRGAERCAGVTRQVPCRVCSGRGAMPADPVACAACQGRGQVRTARRHMVFTKPCERCRGAGRLSEATCRACRGHGVEVRAESLLVQVPAGVEDGAQVRIPGRGHAGRVGGGPGDLVVTVQVATHPLFRREADNVHVVVPVALHEAALGAKIDIPTLDGPVRLRVPPGTPPGKRLRLRERGAPSRRTGGRGDLIVEIRVVLPDLLDERSKELLREFGEINGADVRRDLWAAMGQDAPGA